MFRNLWQKVSGQSTPLYLRRRDTHHLVVQLETEAKREFPHLSYSQWKLTPLPAYQELKEKPDEERVHLLLQLVPYLHELHQEMDRKEWWQASREQWNWKQIAGELIKALLRLKTRFTERQIMDVFLAFRTCVMTPHHPFHLWPLGLAVQQLENRVKQEGKSPQLAAFLREVRDWPEMNLANAYGVDLPRLRMKLDEMAGRSEEQSVVRWDDADLGTYVNHYVDRLDLERRNHLYELFQLADKARSGAPSPRYLAKAKAVIERLGRTDFENHLTDWLLHLSQLRERRIDQQMGTYTYTYYEFLSKRNNLLAKGLTWMLTDTETDKTLSALAKAGEHCYRTIPGAGPAAAAVGAACLYVLAQSENPNALHHLSALKSRIRQTSVRRLIQSYLEEKARRLSLRPEQLEDGAVPDYGLIDGEKRVDFGAFQLHMQIERIGKVRLQWIDAEGTGRASLPAAVKNDPALQASFQELREEAKQIQKTLTAQRDRLDRGYLLERSWTYGEFARSYFNHGLMSFLTRQLIWSFTEGERATEACRHNGRWEDVQGRPLAWMGERTTVRLWHPLHADTETVLAWRERLSERQIQQPFKQAYREVYLLTEAEIATRTYSNRMAAHLLKQHPFNALAQRRGWQYALLGVYDDGRNEAAASLPIPDRRLRAEYWVNPVNADGACNDAGIWNYVATDQVRFVHATGHPVPLTEVPKLIFSEVMRDVDLFVGVASVGNDPEWQDGGDLRQQYRNYWENYAFGELSEISKTRKYAVERLLPRLKIRDVARIEGHYLVVKGTLRTYKIHIGSTNILMEPNDQYLCIVPAQGAAFKPDQLFLPFEGDQGLSLLLSKAFLLAEDERITDETIRRQIRR